MICDFCKQDFKNEFLSMERFKEGEHFPFEVAIICKECKEQTKKING